MSYSYQKLLENKNNNEKLDFNSITKMQLESLFINELINKKEIAELYGVDEKTVELKCQEFELSELSPRYLYMKTKRENAKLFDSLSKRAKENLMGEENIDWISKALTHHVFRNGPIEDMHADGKLTQNDMKTLNKYMVNRIAGLLKLINDNDWIKIELILSVNAQFYGHDWDKAEYDIDEINSIFDYEGQKIMKEYSTHE